MLAVVSPELQAQNCTPDPALTIPGILPATLPKGNINTPYSESITVMLFKDTNVVLQGAPVLAKIDSMVMKSVDGLPKGMGYVCKNYKCVFLPMTASCIEMSGTPTEGGVFPLKIPVQVYAKVFGSIPVVQPDTIRTYVLTIEGGSANVLNLDQLNGVKVYPNPANGEVQIIAKSQPRIFDLSGREVAISFLNKDNGVYQINVSDWKSGMYLVLANGTSQKLVVE
ncbi:MAG: hypothetical protein RL263_1180 [Bacteroidota bacterium]